MAAPPATKDSGSQSEAQLNDNDKFFRYFQRQVTDLQAQFERLRTEAPTGGDRADVVDKCLAGIASLSNDVKDASSYLPAYDQRTYGDAIKALSAKLQDARASLAPRQKFSFRKGPAFTAQKNESAISLSDAERLANSRRMDASSNDSSFPASPAGELADDKPSASTAQPRSVRQPSVSRSKTIPVSDHNNVHIILPASAGRECASGIVSNITRCVIDLSYATGIAYPFAALTLKNIRDSLVVCGHVTSAVHLTNITNSVIVVASRQFRMHESKNCDVYLRTSSRPIVEDCTGIRFAPLPEKFEAMREDGDEGQLANQWDQVDDFKWLRAEASPNWRVLGEEERLAEGVWKEVVPGRAGFGVEDILTEVGLGSKK